MPLIPNIHTFTKKTISVIEYGSDLHNILGPYPNVEVSYYDKIANKYVLSNLPGSRIEFTGNQVIINHGGEESGLIRVF